jgi:hypothetical protein
MLTIYNNIRTLESLGFNQQLKSKFINVKKIPQPFFLEKYQLSSSKHQRLLPIELWDFG